MMSPALNTPVGLSIQPSITAWLPLTRRQAIRPVACPSQLAVLITVMMKVPAAPVPSRLLVATKLTCIWQLVKPVPVTKSPPAKLRLESIVTGGYGGDGIWPLGLTSGLGWGLGGATL